MSNRYNDTRLVHVIPFQGAAIRYGWRTKVDQGDSSVLGHVAVTGNFPPGFVIGANSPKPPRAVRTRDSGDISSFVSFTAVTAARNAGWRVTAGRRRVANTTRLTRTVAVRLGEGIFYAWQIPTEVFTRIGEAATQLGILTPSQDEENLVFGADPAFKPPRAQTRQGNNTISTFIDPDAIDDLPAGWTVLSNSSVPITV